MFFVVVFKKKINPKVIKIKKINDLTRLRGRRLERVCNRTNVTVCVFPLNIRSESEKQARKIDNKRKNICWPFRKNKNPKK